MTQLSKAAQQFQESAIRRTGMLGAAVPGLISLAAGYPAPEVFPWDDQRIVHGALERGVVDRIAPALRAHTRR